MSLHAQPLQPIPELTRQIAHASFLKGTLAMQLRDAALARSMRMLTLPICFPQGDERQKHHGD